ENNGYQHETYNDRVDQVMQGDTRVVRLVCRYGNIKPGGADVCLEVVNNGVDLICGVDQVFTAFLDFVERNYILRVQAYKSFLLLKSIQYFGDVLEVYLATHDRTHDRVRDLVGVRVFTVDAERTFHSVDRNLATGHNDVFGCDRLTDIIEAYACECRLVEVHV